MPAVDPKETAAMKRLLLIMSGGTPPPERETLPGRGVATDMSHTLGNPDVDAMKNILTKFYNATSNAAATLTEDAQYSREVSNALVTDRTPTGAKVGSWEIRVHQINEKLKTYDVVNSRTGENIATELRLYEAAHALVKLFNAGVGINTQQVREVLDTEEQYCKHYQDAVSFRQRMTRMARLNESVKAAIAEDRYAESRQRALLARERLRKLNEAI